MFLYRDKLYTHVILKSLNSAVLYKVMTTPTLKNES